MGRLGAYIKRKLTGIDREAEDIHATEARRVRLEKRRDKMYEEIGNLDKEEAALLKEGKGADTTIKKRRIAGQLSAKRKDIERLNKSASVLGQQINILSTDVENRKITRMTQIAQLPDTEELTKNAVAAEEIVEQITNSSDLADGLVIAGDQMSDEEKSILAEFEDEPETTDKSLDYPIPNIGIPHGPQKTKSEPELEMT